MSSFLAIACLLSSATWTNSARAEAAPAAKVTPSSVPAPAVEVAASADSLVTLTSPAPATQWELATELKCGFWPDGSTCRMSATVPGRYLVLAVTPTETLRYVVVIGPPQPMPPGPGPKPVDPPAPADPLKAAMAAAFAGDPGTAAEKKADALKLASLYAAGSAAAGNAKLTNAQAILDAVRAAGAAMPNPLAATALPGTRKAFAGELSTVLGKSLTSPLTEANRAAVADLFKRAEAILEDLGK